MSTVTAQTDPSRQAATRLRLLEAAAQEFTAHGFQSATVREICRKAEANVAAVNYHFGDKCGLYSATLKHWIGVSLEKFPPLMNVSETAPAEERLRGFVEGSLRRMLDEGAAGWHGQLMAREMVEPTACFDHLVEENLQPMATLLEKIVRDIGGPAMPDGQVRLCAISIIGQCCFYRHSRDLVTRLFGAAIYAGAYIEAIADHVTQFSIAGIRAAAANHAPPAEEAVAAGSNGMGPTVMI